MEHPVIFMHGFDMDALSKMVDAVKLAAPAAGVDPASLIFASSTPINLDWKVKKLIREVKREHEKASPR